MIYLARFGARLIFSDKGRTGALLQWGWHINVSVSHNLTQIKPACVRARSLAFSFGEIPRGCTCTTLRGSPQLLLTNNNAGKDEFSIVWDL